MVVRRLNHNNIIKYLAVLLVCLPACTKSSSIEGQSIKLSNTLNECLNIILGEVNIHTNINSIEDQNRISIQRWGMRMQISGFAIQC